MRFIHTADWHLGRLFLGVHLTDDQAYVLDQFVDLARDVKPDAILIAGDVYDRAVPPTEAVALLDDVLSRLVLEVGTDVVLIAGNHDSAERLSFGSRLLGRQGLHVLGDLADLFGGRASDRPLVLEDRHGPVEIWAIPYADPAVAREWVGASIHDHDSAMRAVLDRATGGVPGVGVPGGEVPSGGPAGHLAETPGTPPEGLFANFATARPGRVGPRSILVTHAFVAGGQASESERPLTVGGAGSVDPGALRGFSYVALGHLHRPQEVGVPEVRYAGSLLKYSFDEVDHTKTVDVVELAGDGSLTRESIALRPRRDVRRIAGRFADLLRGEDAGVPAVRRAGDAAAGGAGSGRADDYLLVTLLDQGPILDAMARLREVYPNVLRIERAGEQGPPGGSGAWAVGGAAGVGGSSGDFRRRMTERELFGGFFADVTGEALTPDESAALDEVLEEVRRGEREGGRPGLEPAASEREEARP